MDTVYHALKWLKMQQALDHFKDLTGRLLTEELAIQFCCEKKLSVYVNIGLPGIEGKVLDTKEVVTLLGMQQVLNPDMAFRDEELSCAVLMHNDAHWVGLLPRHFRAAMFKTDDIEALALTVNETPAVDAETLDSLRQQLTLARGSLGDAEARRETLHLRCRYKGQLLESAQAENAQLRELLADSDAKLKKQTFERPSSEVGAPATSLTFPYATKHLEAMREAAIKHWAGHDRSKPAPYGIQKEVQNFLAERTGENSRKVAELAAAIKPDDLPKS